MKRNQLFGASFKFMSKKLELGPIFVKLLQLEGLKTPPFMEAAFNNEFAEEVPSKTNQTLALVPNPKAV